MTKHNFKDAICVAGSLGFTLIAQQYDNGWCFAAAVILFICLFADAK